ncbi:MAG: 1-(5-phosphoribosyl)-5-[(5-phosphoribosylamino)methylideneamino]imidazole-4-carboxamide isomerase [Candidatus Bathyarchaeia archaeon]
MLIIPSVDISEGKCVKLVQGKLGSGRQISSDPIDVARMWERSGAKTLHVIDLDAAIHGDKENRGVIARLLKQVHIPVQVGGGIRTGEQSSFYVNEGARWIIVGTAAIENPEFMSTAVSAVGSSRIIVAIDSRKGIVVTRGWTSESQTLTLGALSYFALLDPAAVLYTDVEVEGTLVGLNIDHVQSLASSSSVPLIYSGGISSLDEIRALSKTEVKAVVIGRALYDGRFTLAEAQEAAGDA